MKKVCVGIVAVMSVLYCLNVYAGGAVNTTPVPEFKKQPSSLHSDFFSEHVWTQGERVIRFDMFVRPFLRPEARNVLPDGNVDNSWFYENRLGSVVQTPEDVKQGNVKAPPAEGKWTIIKAKTDGRSTGFFMKDGAGDRFLVKVDHQAYPEMNSSAEIISARLLYALGYYVPEYTIVYFTFDDLVVPEDVTFYDETGFEKKLSKKDLAMLLRSCFVDSQKRYRASASRLVDGAVLGPMDFSGRRAQDPLDLIRHEDRRELRGLRVFCSWLNHMDVRRGNTLDVLHDDGDSWYVKHYLIDFGSTLGAFTGRGKTPEHGKEYVVTPQEILKSILTLGFYKRPWVRKDTVYPQTGYFTNKDFDPRTWRPQIPNYAFQNMTAADAQWAAKILKEMTDDHIDAAISAGEISSDRARDDLSRKLKERRDILVQYWMSK